MSLEMYPKSSAVVMLKPADFSISSNGVYLNRSSSNISNLVLPAYLEFFANWCPHCHHQKAGFNRLAEMSKKMNGGKSSACAVDMSVSSNSNSRLMSACGASGYPSFFIIHQDGRVERDESFDVSGNRIEHIQHLLNKMGVKVRNLAHRKANYNAKKAQSNKSVKKSPKNKKVSAKSPKSPKSPKSKK